MQNLALLAAVALFVAALFLVGTPALWFDPLAVAVVVAAPLALSCARRGVARTAADFGLAWRAGAEAESATNGLKTMDSGGILDEAPPAFRARAAANLRGIGSDALSLGVLFAFANVVALLRSFTYVNDPTSDLLGQLGALFFGPVLGLAFKALVCDALAVRVGQVVTEA